MRWPKSSRSRWRRSTRSRPFTPTSTWWRTARRARRPVTVRVCDSLSCALAGAEELLRSPAGRDAAGRARGARAVHRLVPHGARRRGGPPPRRSRHAGQGQGPGAARRCARRDAGLPGLRRLREGRRLRRAALLPVGRAQGGGRDRGAVRRRPARARRRRLPDGAQMGPGARREGSAPDGGQRRRGRARHLQGPHLPREASRTSFSRAC